MPGSGLAPKWEEEKERVKDRWQGENAREPPPRKEEGGWEVDNGITSQHCGRAI